MSKIIARLTPFILLGMAIVGFAFGLFLFAYLLFFGAAVGLAIFAAAWIKGKFFPSKQIVRDEKDGRTIDQK